MLKKTMISIILISLGVITGLLVYFSYSRTGGNTTVTLIFFAIAVILIIAGTILSFSRLLDRIYSPVLDEVSEAIVDDIQDIKAHRMTNVHVMVLITGISAFAFTFFVLRFHKFEAMWGSIPVIIPTGIALAVVAWLVPRTRWFLDKRTYTPMWVYLIPAAGLILSLALGLNKTEDPQILRGQSQQSIQYNTYQAPDLIFQTLGGTQNMSIDLDIPDCDDDVCGIIALIVGLIILTLILVVGSAMIPHFWLLSCTVLISLMALIAIHDLLVRPYQVPSH